jgi:molybdenum cofactor biosynthesis protein B
VKTRHRHAHRDTPRISAGVAVLTVSDTRTEETDRSGATIRRRLQAEGHRVVDYRILPDEPARVRQAIEQWLGRDDCEVILINGGTGIAGRDRTYEAVTSLLDKRLDGFGEIFRMLSHAEIGSAAMLSRAVGGIARGRPVFSMPGSTPAVQLALERLILPEIGHLLAELGKDVS